MLLPKEFIKSIKSQYIHFPFCKSLCNYCDFFRTPLTDTGLGQYESFLKNSISQQNMLLEKKNLAFDQIETLYIGGGTPSLWGDSGVTFVESEIIKKLPFAGQYEFTLEINPGAWQAENLRHWRELGVNRFSVGIQTLSEKILPFLSRAHNIEESYKTLEFLATSQINYSADLMIGLPFSDVEQVDIISELEKLISFHPSHISLYILTPKDNYKYIDNLPCEDWIANQYLRAAQFLKSKKFHHYEVSNFAQENKKSLHNLKYWKAESVAALGPSATGLLSTPAQKLRYKWHHDLSQCQYDTEELTSEESQLEQLYLGLRTDEGISPSAFFNSEYYSAISAPDLLLRWNDFGYLEDKGRDKNRLRLTSNGMLMLDSIMGDIFKFLKENNYA
ncbi:MAG: hypothetical protein A2504_11445 [Bdellovibrionales bacterium RIFOXYD12_FULL_39_22]|nr:MAG: hypothetical protein A2385_15960 [Bdellovibrionales bacterium RIFOXYB1_FULL_39_21]OFZ44547.1 MAG: hypothetical protein A2485_06935 [Bdellovibrionales bacterium RIFOXYC12_FULL_39_17]OFZ49811.1 MAG: hypothetical protein A2404_00530 [Bdellovibrionales bacterium RIFOXYC1_FULL_39_130]OFZ72085.1 MAG: hypothetical protein A2451_09195 [Bdellovibrionales bacterium RIFOXYC2_FULL_39_8]OFZ76816.1 MAG: hypothetical protein A2560_05330 [Bdellovibrionales bacterium RIFOXYD1_FULL_39_84]OFZ95743.1 MAG: